jgi:hypothetical protein
MKILTSRLRSQYLLFIIKNRSVLSQHGRDEKISTILTRYPEKRKGAVWCRCQLENCR